MNYGANGSGVAPGHHLFPAPGARADKDDGDREEVNKAHRTGERPEADLFPRAVLFERRLSADARTSSYSPAGMLALPVAAASSAPFGPFSAACAAARRAIGTRNGEQDT